VRKAIEEAQRGAITACLIPIIPKVDLQFLADHGPAIPGEAENALKCGVKGKGLS
jgi:hypothetical protein